MKLKEILLGQAIRFIRLREPIGGIYIIDFAKALQEKFRFITMPKSLAEWDRTKGIRFEHGVFKLEDRSMVLDRLEIFNNGVGISTRAYTEDADQFIDALIEWSIQTFGFRHDPALPTQKMFLSNVEVEMKNTLTMRSKVLEATSQSLSKRLAEYGLESKPFETVGIAMHFDTEGMSVPVPTNFKLERREGSGFGQNAWFSTAPLHTKDHLALLEEIEAIS